MALFLEHAAVLGQKLGAILFQLPPGLEADKELLEAFLEELPTTYRYVFEFRNADWYQPDLYRLLQKYNCAFCIYELGDHLSPIEVTTDFVYVRLHGPGIKYQGNYSEEVLQEWAGLCKEWLETKDVFVYFDNTAEEGYAPFNALRLAELVGAGGRR